MRFRLLGRPELRVDGVGLDLGPPRQQTVLAVLLLAANQPVPVGGLIDRVWDDAPPSGAQYTLATYISRLRRILHQTSRPPVEISNRGGAYVLRCDPQAVDVFSFREVVREGRRAAGEGDHDAAVEHYDAALQLWHGAALSGLSGDWVADTAAALDRERRQAETERIDCLLRLGLLAPALDDLSRLVMEHPDDERLAEQHLRTLHAHGRTAEAIRHYHTLRKRLADDLGVDPCRQIQETYLWLLRGDASESEPPDPRRNIAPAQLPADVPTFTGRADQMRLLDALMEPRRDGPAIAAISGTAGVGKSALAVHWAHQVRHRFPDGQLFVNLGGFGPADPAMSSAEAVRGFLDALGVGPNRMPPQLQAQVGLYRSILTGSRVLVVLDNARDAEQVRPLLPGSRECLVVVTSRNQLTGLTATDGAQPVELDLLTAIEARDLLARRLGAGRVAAEPDAVDRVVRRCVGLPLALAVVAARATHRTDLPLTVLAEQLGELDGDLDAFADEDTATNVRAVFSWSYRDLRPAAARLFRLLGLHPAREITAPSAASLAGVARPEADRALAELTGAHLLAEHRPGRYSMHDLLRAYANELTTSIDAESERRAAVHRALDHHLHTAHAAALLLNPLRDTISLAEPRAGVVPEGLVDAGQAMSWFAAERPTLLAAIDLATTAGFALHAWQLAWTGRDYFQRAGHWHDWVSTQHAAVLAARQLTDPVRLAHAYRSLGRATATLGEYEDAHQYLAQALDIYRGAGDSIGQAQTHRGISNVLDEQERHAEALAHGEIALLLYRAVGHRAGEASCLNALGWHGAHLGAYSEALTRCERALALHQEIGDRSGEAATWDSLGYVHQHLGDLDAAGTCYRRALDLYRVVGYRLGEAATLVRLGDAFDAGGRSDDASRARRQALAILEELDHHDADAVRERLTTSN